MNDPLLYLFGAFGALLYSFPVYLAAASTTPPGRFALVILAFSVVVGAVVGPVLVPMLGNWKPWLVTPEPYPLALGIGLAINPLMPIIIRRLTKYAEAFNPGGVKP